MLLEVDALDVRYGPIAAVRGVSLLVDEAEVVCVLGANGAGKTSLLSAIAGVIRSSARGVRVDGRDVRGRSATAVARHGVVLVPEGRRIFADLTVAENLDVAGHLLRKRDVAARRDEILDLFPHLAARRDQPGGVLSGGEQQMLALGRALMTQPRLVLLDEPSMGLAPVTLRVVYEGIRHLVAEGAGVVLVEQNTKLALSVATRGYILQTGEVVAQGTTAELAETDAVKSGYMGTVAETGASVETTP